MRKVNFMRILVLFDLPMETKTQRKTYRELIKFLKSEGYIRIQFSVYAKICINFLATKTAIKRLEKIAPTEGNIRYMVITETQYLQIKNINEQYSLQEKTTTLDRTFIVGGLDDDH